MKRIRFLWKCLLLCSLSVAPYVARAATGEVLTLMVSGNPVTIFLADHPVITYTGNTLHIATEETTIDVPVSEISDASFQTPVSIKPVTIPDCQTINGELRFSQLPAGSTVEVFYVNGKKLSSAVVGNEGQTTIDISRLPKGVFVVKTAMQTIKVTNKSK